MIRVRLKKAGTKSLLAYFDFLDTDTGLEYRGWRLFEGARGTFVKSPARPYPNRNGETKYEDFVTPIYNRKTGEFSQQGQDYLADVAAEALRAYEAGEFEESFNRRESGSREGRDNRSRQSNSRAGNHETRSGRGPRTPSEGRRPARDMDDLPF